MTAAVAAAAATSRASPSAATPSTPRRASIRGPTTTSPGPPRRRPGASSTSTCSRCPRTRRASRCCPSRFNRSDGFSPGNLIATKVPGLDTQAELTNDTGAAPITEIEESLELDQPIVVINADTGERQLIFSEIDANPADPADRALIIRPGENFEEGERYIVALRNLQDSSGPIAPDPVFEDYRDGDPDRGPRARGPPPAHGAALRRARRGRGRADRAQRPLHGLGLHGRQPPEPQRARPVHARRRVRPARRHRPLRHAGPGGLRLTGIHRGHGDADAGRPRDRPRGRGHLRGPLLPQPPGLPDRLPVPFQPGTQPAAGDPGQHDGRQLHLHHLPGRDRPPQPRSARVAAVAVRPRAARQRERGQRRKRAGDGRRAQLHLLRDRLGRLRDGRRADDPDRAPGPQPLPQVRRPHPAGVPQLPLPRAADDPPRRLRHRSRVPGRRAGGARARHPAALLRRQQPGRDPRRLAGGAGARLQPRRARGARG